MATLNRFFGGLKGAGVSGRGNYFPYANAQYGCEIQRFFYKEERKGCFIAEIRVLEVHAFSSSKHDVVQPQPGETRSWVIDTTKELNMVQRDLNGFLVAMVGVNMNNQALVARVLDEAESLAQFSISDSNPFGGIKVNLETFEHKTKAKGNDFTIHNWMPAADNIGFDAWLGRMKGGAQQAYRPPTQQQQQYVAPAAQQQYIQAPAPAQVAAAPAGAPVQIGGKWYVPDPSGNLRPIG